MKSKKKKCIKQLKKRLKRLEKRFVVAMERVGEPIAKAKGLI